MCSFSHLLLLIAEHRSTSSLLIVLLLLLSRYADDLYFYCLLYLSSCLDYILQPSSSSSLYFYIYKCFNLIICCCSCYSFIFLRVPGVNGIHENWTNPSKELNERHKSKKREEMRNITSWKTIMILILSYIRVYIHNRIADNKRGATNLFFQTLGSIFSTDNSILDIRARTRISNG